MADASFEREFLDTHNAYRRKHGAPPLTMNRDLSRSAQSWAQHLLSIRTMKHSNTSNGENIYYSWSSAPRKLTGREAVDSWYSEIKDYSFSRPGFSSSTGHFTQVVWKSTTELGVGLATDGYTVFVVGQYSSAGNVSNPGYFQKNVLPPGQYAQLDEPKRPAAPCKSTCDAMKELKVSDTVGKEENASGDSFEWEFLDAHNAFRRKHGAPPLKMNRDLSRSALSWAQRLLSMKAMQHSNTSNGENLYYSWSSAPKKPNGKEAVEQWYNEIKDYNFSRPGFHSSTGHFTQVVWKSTTELGVGLATDGYAVFVVGQYSPAGNVTNAGYFQQNVLPAGTYAQEHGEDQPNDPAADRPLMGKDVELKKFRQSLVEAQNVYRKLHGAEPLKLCPDLSKDAQDWATYLVSIRTLKNSDEEHGQNFWNRWSNDTTPPTGSEVAEAWYKESEKYDFSSPGYQSGTDNFAQMVWRYSKNIGIGLATNGQGLFIVVAYYDPCGNIPKKAYYRDNVLAKKTHK